jgi:Cys-tRNA(Pro)/Cys-tRNA(Cys) deacylase
LLDAAAVAYRLHTHAIEAPSGHDGPDTAAALGVSPERVYKTLVADVAGGLAVGVVPVAGELDLMRWPRPWAPRRPA